VNGSWSLSPQPSARETREIVFRLGHILTARGARVRHDIVGGFRFRLPLPWHRGRKLGALRVIFSGRVTIGAGAGEPWRARYQLRFTLLTITTVLLSIALLKLGFHWPRGRLLGLLGLVWGVVYGIPCARAMREFRQLVTEAARESVRD
jgi:hypothetical protein